MENIRSNPLIKKLFIIMLIVVIILVLLYFLNRHNAWKKNNPTLVNKVVNAKKLITVSAEKIPNSQEGTEFTYNFWMFVNDWNYKYGEAKCVMYKGDKGANQTSPGVWLYPDTNRLMVRVACHNSDVKNNYLYPENNNNMNPLTNESMLSKEGTQYVCDIPNIPLQRWVNVGIVLFNRTVDVYMNGKLARSCILPGIPKLNNKDLHIADFGGFGGFLSCLKVSNRALDPRKMYDLYEKGPDCNNLGLTLDNYKMEVKIGKTNDWEDAASAAITI